MKYELITKIQLINEEEERFIEVATSQDNPDWIEISDRSYNCKEILVVRINIKRDEIPLLIKALEQHL